MHSLGIHPTYEGATYALRFGFDEMKALGLSAGEIVLTGGGSNSATWRQVVADVFDALLSKRVYKASWSTDEVFQYILDARGSHFDPLVVDACLACRDDFLATAARYAD